VGGVGGEGRVSSFVALDGFVLCDRKKKGNKKIKIKNNNNNNKICVTGRRREINK
jgi:hypothetical protein